VVIELLLEYLVFLLKDVPEIFTLLIFFFNALLLLQLLEAMTFFKLQIARSIELPRCCQNEGMAFTAMNISYSVS